MVSSLHLEDVAYRFQPFVGELRSFLKQSEVAYGFPEHLLTFTEKLSTSTPLRAGLSARLLDVISATPQPVSHGELVDLLLVTVGGATIDEDTPTIQKAERVLSQVVGEVMTSREVVSIAEPALGNAPTEAPARPPAKAPAADQAVVHVESAPAAAPPTEDIVVAAIQPRPAVAQAMVWASPPGFLWAALLCGVLLPPSMYLLSLPRGLPAPPPQISRTSATHATVGAVSPPRVDLPAPYEMKPLDLDFFDDAPEPKRTRRSTLRQPATVKNAPLPDVRTLRPKPATEVQLPAGTAGGISPETHLPGVTPGPRGPAQSDTAPVTPQNR